MHMFGPTPLRFRYTATYLPKRCWYERDAYFIDDAFAMIRKAEPDEAPVAFKVRFPIRKNRAPIRFEIRRYDGLYWWPLTSGGTVVDPPLTESRFISGLAVGEDFLDVQGPKERFKEARPVKTIVHNNRDYILTTLLRELAENVLLCGELVYIPGGQPVFVSSRNFGDERGEITVASTGPDRALSLCAHGLHHAAGNYGSNETQKAFCSGQFDLAADRAAAQERARPIRYDRDYVPVVDAAMSNLPLLSKDEIRLDAIFRRAMASNDSSVSSLLAKPFEAERECYSVLKEVAAREPGGNTVTADRLRALRTLTSFAKARPPHEVSSDLRDILRQFEEIDRSKTLSASRMLLTPEEDDALRDFA